MLGCSTLTNLIASMIEHFDKHFLASVVEPIFLDHNTELQWPPIFIVGAPRTGSTLLYEALVSRYEFSYLNNLIARFPHSPCFASYLSRVFFGKGPYGVFKSHLGETPGLDGPHEAWNFWYRWFPRNSVHNYSPAGSISTEALEEMRKNVASISRIFDKPIVFKNMYNSLRIGPFREAFGDILFMYLKRDPFYCAQSILLARRSMFGSMREWWSLKPKEFEFLRDLSFCEQAVGQVYFTEKQIEEDLQSLSKKRVFRVKYRHFCEHPLAVLERVHKWLDESGVHVEIRGAIPPRFRTSRQIKVPEEIAHELRAAVQKYYSPH